MDHFSDMSTRSIEPITPPAGGDPELQALCEKIRTVDGDMAKELPVQVLRYLAKSLGRIEIDIHVEECLPVVCEACHAFVRAMGTFSQRHADCDAVEQTRLRLIQSLETFADEARLCEILYAAKPVPRSASRSAAA